MILSQVVWSATMVALKSKEFYLWMVGSSVFADVTPQLRLVVVGLNGLKELLDLADNHGSVLDRENEVLHACNRDADAIFEG